MVGAELFFAPGERAAMQCFRAVEVAGAVEGFGEGDRTGDRDVGLGPKGLLAIFLLGLHTGPLRLRTHPLTGAPVIRGERVTPSDDLAALEPAGLIYASSAFAALLGLDPQIGTSCEFLGYPALRAGGVREPVFQLTS